MPFIISTLHDFGCRLAFLKSSADARCDRLTSKLKEGPISSTSTLGECPPDFFKLILQIIVNYCVIICLEMLTRLIQY